MIVVDGDTWNFVGSLWISVIIDTCLHIWIKLEITINTLDRTLCYNEIVLL